MYYYKVIKNLCDCFIYFFSFFFNERSYFVLMVRRTRTIGVAHVITYIV